MRHKIIMATALSAVVGGLIWLITPQNQGEHEADGKGLAQTQPQDSPSQAAPAPGKTKPGTGQAAAAAVATPSPAASGNTGGQNAAMPLPEPIPQPARQPRTELWKVDAQNPSTQVNGIPATRIAVSPRSLDGMHVGQEVTLPIPALNRSVTAKITSTHNQLNNVEVFKGPITDGHPKDNVIITRGQTSTYVVVATREGTYSATIDNRTGNASLTDEGDINAGIHPGDDSVTVPGIEMPIPGSG